MESGPVPPHERTWRHPSELGPTRVDVELADGTGRTPLAALAGGTVAVMAVAFLVVAMTPRTSSGPIALSATTTPIIASVSDGRSLAPAPLRVQTLQVSSNDQLLASFPAFPHSVSSGPQLDLDGTAVAKSKPARDDTVFVRTQAVTYQMRWSAAEAMLAPDGSVVFDDDGDLVAYVANGVLVSLVDD